MKPVTTITAEEFRKMGGASRPRGRKPTPESLVLRQVRDFLHAFGWKVVRIHQSLGSEKGIPDLVAVREGRHVWIECKAPKGKLSPDQERWLQDLEDHGGWYIVARGIEDVEHLAEPVAPRAKVWALVVRGRVLCASAVCDERCPNRSHCVEAELLILPPARR